MDDLVQLRGLRCMGTHGLLAEERSRAQPFEVDADLSLDLKAAAESDDLADTVDYAALAASVVAVVSGPPVALLERLADRIAAALLADGRVRSVTVWVRKLRPPVDVDLATAGVRVTRP